MEKPKQINLNTVLNLFALGALAWILNATVENKDRLKGIEVLQVERANAVNRVETAVEAVRNQVSNGQTTTDRKMDALQSQVHSMDLRLVKIESKP